MARTKKPPGFRYREASEIVVRDSPGRVSVPLLGFELRLGQTDRALALLPLAALLHELDALKTLENRTLTADGTSSFKSGVLGHIL